MELGYLRGLNMRTAGRFSFGERGRPAGQVDEKHEAIERTTNVLDDLVRDGCLSGEAVQVITAAVRELMRAGF